MGRPLYYRDPDRRRVGVRERNEKKNKFAERYDYVVLIWEDFCLVDYVVIACEDVVLD